MVDFPSSAAVALERLRAHFGEADRAIIDTMERVKARFLRTERDGQLAKQFQWLLRSLVMRADPRRPPGPDNRREARALVLVGRSGAGKTAILERLFSRHPAFPGYGDPLSDCGLITVPVPAPCSLTQLGRETLKQLGYPLKRVLKGALVWELVFERLHAKGILVLHFDEMHNVTQTANVLEIKDIRKTLKALQVNKTWNVALVISGLPELVPFMETQAHEEDTETEVRRRCRFVELKSLRLPNDIRMIFQAVKDLVAVARLSFADDHQEILIPRLIHASLYELGTSMELAHEAIEEALVRGDAVLDTGHFADTYAARTGSAAPANPFLAPDWLSTDCSKVLRKNNEPTEPVPDRRDKRPLSKRRRRRG